MAGGTTRAALETASRWSVLLLAVACTSSGPPSFSAAPEKSPELQGEGAEAPPQSSSRPSSAALPDESAYRRTLARGRARHRAGDYPGAIAAFEQALAMRPGDSPILVEMGWAALFAGDLERSAALQRLALAQSRDPELRGAAAYNLGRALEAMGQRERAAEAYQDSLRVRTSSVVERRLVDAGESVARRDFGFASRIGHGPHRSLWEYCDELAELEPEPERRSCDVVLAGEHRLRGARVDVPSAVEAMGLTELLPFATRREGEDDRLHLGMRTGAGWFVLQELGTRTEAGQGAQEVAVDVVERASGTYLLVSVQSLWELGDDPRAWEAQEIYRHAFVCSTGPSGRPSCTGELPWSGETHERVSEPGRRGARILETRWDNELEVLDDGRVALKGDERRVGEQVAALYGTHAVTFW